MQLYNQRGLRFGLLLDNIILSNQTLVGASIYGCKKNEDIQNDHVYNKVHSKGCAQTWCLMQVNVLLKIELEDFVVGLQCLPLSSCLHL